MEFLTAFASPWGFGTVASICLLIAFVFFRSGTLKLSRQGLEIGKGQKLKVSPHAACPHARDIMEIIHRTLDYSDKRQIMQFSLLENQMNFYEEEEEGMHNEFKRIFLKLLSEKIQNYDSVVQHSEYNAYVITIKAISADIKNYIRTCFRSNHYSTFSLEDQREYIEKKIVLIIQKTTEFLNLYWKGTIVTRSALHNANMQNIHEFQSYLQEIFDRAFMLARETDEKLKEMERSYNLYITGMIGEQ